MKELSKHEKRIVNLAKSGGKDSDLAILNSIKEIEDKFDETVKELKTIVPDLPNLLREIKGGKGDTGIHGERGDKGDKGDSIVGPQGEKGDKGDSGEKGADGKDSTVPGPKGDTGASGKDGSPDTSDDIRNKLELLEGDERLDKKAIKGLEEIEKDIKVLKSRPAGGGGTSAMGVRQAFKLIAHTEEPTGDIDGVNVTYRVKNEIFWIAGFTLNGEQVAQLPNFTYAGRVITFSSAIPADYSGKDFEIKYIG